MLVPVPAKLLLPNDVIFINLAPSQGRGSSTHRVCVSVCLSVTVLAGATGT